MPEKKEERQVYEVVPHSPGVEINPRVMMGEPVIRGTRITVELLLRKISEGAGEDDLLDAYPRLHREDIRDIVATPRRSAARRG